MSTFYLLMKQSIIVQALITLIIVSTISYLYIIGQPVPSDLMTIAVLILGFYFGSKTQQRVDRSVMDYENSIDNYPDR